ncbi:zinc finger domain-containing protein [Streptomyces ziwulingensis]|uniref:DNA-binding phage zinc finger domain-containing protein n=1 Tax=Streptomyces ziwulingensis TaxID=1045501 RepID=A0ABP9D006_9ACTN
MTIRPAAPMPESIRHGLRAKQHPARSVPCPHCGAHAHRPCTVRTRNRILTEPHPQRVSSWAQTVACCPDCQVTPTVPCHENGRSLPAVHARRHQEAQETAA